jgi:hypothetical protein
VGTTFVGNVGGESAVVASMPSGENPNLKSPGSTAVAFKV